MRRKKLRTKEWYCILGLILLGLISILLLIYPKISITESSSTIRVEFDYIFITTDGKEIGYKQQFPVGVSKTTQTTETEEERPYLLCTVHLIPRTDLSFTDISFNGNGFPKKIYLGNLLKTVDEIEALLKERGCLIGVV